MINIVQTSNMALIIGVQIDTSDSKNSLDDPAKTHLLRDLRGFMKSQNGQHTFLFKS